MAVKLVYIGWRALPLHFVYFVFFSLFLFVDVFLANSISSFSAFLKMSPFTEKKKRESTTVLLHIQSVQREETFAQSPGRGTLVFLISQTRDSGCRDLCVEDLHPFIHCGEKSKIDHFFVLRYCLHEKIGQGPLKEIMTYLLLLVVV